MENTVKRLFVEKKCGYHVAALNLLSDLRDNLGIDSLEYVKIIIRYDVEGISDGEMESAKHTIFSEPPVDTVYDETYPIANDEKVIAMEYLPGQFDQRADSAAQCVQMLTGGDKPTVQVAKLIVMGGHLSDKQYSDIKNYVINPIEAHTASLEKPETLESEIMLPDDIEEVCGFTDMNTGSLKSLLDEMGLAMTVEDLKFIQQYFIEEGMNPTETEIRMLDTYWSDHCRHTTFLTQIDKVEFEDSPATEVMYEAYINYISMRERVHGRKLGSKPICLMDMATIAMKYLSKSGKLNDLDESDEINACSIVVEADIDGKNEEWVVMFKNETHNHPTEIEPFGGAATCLGGAIRDPLSGRSYVYQAMRVTGSGDPGTPRQKTLQGKLQQRKITTGAAEGYSSYGNQIGLATGKVVEIYDEGYVAKRMEIGAVVGAAPRKNIKRSVPEPGDKVILVGGRTGRDGCGGATGSSKEHTEDSLETCGAEVQKGNPTTERKLQRLFRNPAVSVLIKRCNDFGAGGVAVAIGELADGLDINLDAILKKYEGLNGTELAISESQERMAVVVDDKDVEAFRKFSDEENLEAVVVAEVTDTNRLRMLWRDGLICDISRDFINTNGVSQVTKAKIVAPDYAKSPLHSKSEKVTEDWLQHIAQLSNCSQKGLAERFDSTIGAGTVIMPFGGKTQMTPSEGMVSKLPVEKGDTTTVTMMAHGFDPEISKWSPFHGAVYAVIESVARVVAMGGDYKKIRLTFQEYFEKLGNDPVKWGKPAAALLGAVCVQQQLGIAAIGGKDSMSGTFKDINVPPTLVSFALATGKTGHVVNNYLTRSQSKLVLLKPKVFSDGLPNMSSVKAIFSKVHELAVSGELLAASSVKSGGLAATISEMTLGNMIGVKLEPRLEENLYDKMYGAMLLEVDATRCPCDDAVLCWEENESQCLIDIFGDVPYRIIGMTIDNPYILMGNVQIHIADLKREYEKTLEKVFPTKAEIPPEPKTFNYNERSIHVSSGKIAKPRVFIPVFPGTNCEYDSAKRFEAAGGIADLLVVKNLTSNHIEESIKEMVKRINQSQIIMIPGGFSSGDEPDGSGKFIATAFRNPRVSEAVMDLLNNRDGLMLGICNGFQAMIKLGLLPYGEIRDMNADSPTLTYNYIGRHVSCYVNTRVASVKSPWLAKLNLNQLHKVPVSHGEGRFVASEKEIEEMAANGQIAFQYTDRFGTPANQIEYNPNGSFMAIEGITSPDGRILGKMGHSERIGKDIAVNIEGNKDQKIFESGIEYFTK